MSQAVILSQNDYFEFGDSTILEKRDCLLRMYLSIKELFPVLLFLLLLFIYTIT